MDGILGIVAEYNPLHNGHYYHLHKARQDTNCSHVVIAMSGNFVQRGLPALVDKWTRAEMALNAGADLVVEIPTYHVLQSAQGFAQAGISLLSQCKITHLSFGSESGDIEALQELAGWLNTNTTQQAIAQELKSGITYAAAIEELAKRTNSISDLAHYLDGANNILAIEYLLACLRLKISPQIHTVKRVGPKHNSPQTIQGHASATKIRELVKARQLNLAKEFMPDFSWDILTNLDYKPVFIEDFNQALFYALAVTNTDLKTLPAVSEGLDNRLTKFSTKYQDIPQLLKALKTKRYPLTRIQRLLMQVLLQFQRLSNPPVYPPYTRVLACSKNGKKLFSTIGGPLVFSGRDVKGLNPSARELLNLDAQAAAIYNLPQNQPNKPDLSQQPVYL